MSFSINWTDVPENADSDEFLQKCFFSLNELNESNEKHLNLSETKDLLFKSQYSFISGDNFPSLRLLENDFTEKIDLIYIDPPYNTGKTSFVYNDAFSLKNDRHSAWLSFMNRRLKCAKNLLSENGCIFIAIGQDELYYLKILCDEIFGEENFINDFMWLCGKGKKDSFSRTMQQSNLCYAKNIKKLKPFAEFEETSWAKTNCDNDSRGNWFSGSISFSEKRSNPNHPNYFEIVSPSGKKWKRQWLVSKDEMNLLLRENRIYWGKSPEFDKVPRKKIFNGEKIKIIPKNIIAGNYSTRSAQNYLDSLLGMKNSFDNPKPVELIEHLISICNMKNDITIMDFFAGSGTTLEAVYNLNQKDEGKRRCILIQKPEKIETTEISESFINSTNLEKRKFANLSELCLARIKKVLGNAENILELKMNSPEL